MRACVCVCVGGGGGAYCFNSVCGILIILIILPRDKQNKYVIIS